MRSPSSVDAFYFLYGVAVPFCNLLICDRPKDSRLRVEAEVIGAFGWDLDRNIRAQGNPTMPNMRGAQRSSSTGNKGLHQRAVPLLKIEPFHGNDL